MEVSAAKNGPVAEVLEELRDSDAAEAGVLEEFARRVLRRVSEEWLQDEDTARVAEAVRALFHLVEETPDEEVGVSVLPSDEVEHRTYLLTCMPDSAFIVETLREGMHGRSLAIEALLHPVLVLRRDEDDRIVDVRDRTTDGPRMSAVLVVLDGAMSADEAADLARETESNLNLLQTATSDFHPMVERVEQIVADLEEAKQAMSWRAAEIKEVQELLEWLADGNFVFLGFRRYIIDTGGDQGQVHVDPGSGLGILRDESRSAFASPVPVEELPPGLRARLVGGPLLIVSKTNSLSPVHRRARMDDISVKKIGPDGQVQAERRFLGLFTAKAFAQDASQIPILRRKLREILEAEQVDKGSHDHGLIVRTFNNLPKEDLFLTPVPELLGIIDAVVETHGTEDILIYARPDALARGANVMVILPRRKFSGEVRQRIQEILVDAFDGRLLNYYLTIGEGEQARLHFYLASDVRDIDTIDIGAVRDAIRETVLTWNERLTVQLEDRHDRGRTAELVGRYGGAFSSAYRAATNVGRVADDIGRLENVRTSGERQIVLADLAPPRDNAFELRVFDRGARFVLSDVMPVLENMGFRVLEADAYVVETEEAQETTIHTFEVETPAWWDVDRSAAEERMSDAFHALQREWTRNLEINGLILSAGLTWRETALLHAYAAYAFRIGGVPSRLAVRRPLTEHPRAARLLFEVFSAQFDPHLEGDRDATIQALEDAFLQYLEDVRSIEDDRTLRRLYALVRATVRTNYFQSGLRADPGLPVALKFSCGEVDFMPEPVPRYEVWVSNARTEGAHLRMDEVARGGLRWSDRPEDFRTEVLGLVKTQQVKNAVIVPAGAKGAFVVAGPPEGPETADTGVRVYGDFVGALLDVTDNVVGTDVVHPPETVIRDGEDPYLVVAADKGTARFSDIANTLAADRGFWLGDAFASGGSRGYDHKEMGITARGAWECVKRHFREMGRDIQSEDFTVCGIGDMSGDVFGNGMLLSRHIRLVAAFDHRHIFLDPDPDPEVSWEERRRLFERPDSTWMEYDEARISAGGGVFERGAKRIPLSERVRARLDVEDAEMNGDALIRAILTAPVDLLWNGGIGTYVKAEGETAAQVGDPGTDTVRVDAAKLRCRVIGEGGNLGLTQRARIEYGMHGGRCNTDALDNSAGVDTSDHEVNIKILLGAAIEAGELQPEDRDAVLDGAEADVADRVLRNNYTQSLAVTLDEYRVRERPEVFRQALTVLERTGILDRKIEELPATEDMVERERSGLPVMTRPELSVLLAYSKLYLKRELLHSSMIDDPGLADLLRDYFPASVREAAGDGALSAHRLGPHIACTRLTNTAVDTAGGATLVQLVNDTGRGAAKVLKAWYAAYTTSAAQRTVRRIHALDHDVPAGVQAQWLLKVGGALDRATRWLLANEDLSGLTVAELLERYGESVGVLAETLLEHLSERKRREVDERMAIYQTDGMARDLARDLVALEFVDGLLPVAALARKEALPASRVGSVYFGLASIIDFPWLQERLDDAASGGPWDLRAAKSLALDLESARTRIVRQLLTGPHDEAEAALEAFRERCREGLERIATLIAELRDLGRPKIPALMVAIHAIREECAAWANGNGGTG